LHTYVTGNRREKTSTGNLGQVVHYKVMEWEVKEKRIKEKGKEIDFKTKMNRSGV
jgi:hypothetical protein